MNVALAVGARFDRLPPCLHHGVVIPQVPVLFALTLVLDAFASHCTRLHERHTAYGLPASGDVLHLLSDFEEGVQPAPVHDQSVPQRVVLQVQRHQTALYLVLNVDACNLLESQAPKARGTRCRRQTIPAALSANTELSNSLAGPSPGQNESSRPSPSRELPTTPIVLLLWLGMSGKCGVELLSFSGPLVKTTFMTGVSDATELFMAFVNFSCWSMCSNMTSSQWFTHRKKVRRACQTFPIPWCRSVLLTELALGWTSVWSTSAAALHPSLQRVRRHCSFPASRCGLRSLSFSLLPSLARLTWPHQQVGNQTKIEEEHQWRLSCQRSLPALKLAP